MLLNKVKQALRLDTSDFDEELKDMINACKKDLETSGVGVVDESDALIIQAVIVYCRANFDVSNTDYERYATSYESLKIHLSLSSDYKEVVEDESV